MACGNRIDLLRAGDGIRTHDNDVGNVVLYQLSYTRLAHDVTAYDVSIYPYFLQHVTESYLSEPSQG
jgi:hypothetical protein